VAGPKKALSRKNHKFLTQNVKVGIASAQSRKRCESDSYKKTDWQFRQKGRLFKVNTYRMPVT
jgi:hypothetical protein